MSDINQKHVDSAVQSIKDRLSWPSLHWGTEGLHSDALPHIARAALEGVNYSSSTEDILIRAQEEAEELLRQGYPVGVLLRILYGIDPPEVPTEEKIKEVLDKKYPWTVRYGGEDVPNPESPALRIGFKAGVEWMKEGAP